MFKGFLRQKNRKEIKRCFNDDSVAFGQALMILIVTTTYHCGDWDVPLQTSL